jgi:VanZ family protein
MGPTGTGLAKPTNIAMPVQMRAGLPRTLLRFLTWACVVLLAVLSLMPLEEIEAVRTGLPGQIEHIIAYAGSTAIAMAGYGLSRGAARIIGCFWLYAATLEYLQNFSLGRNPTLVDFAASAFGALCGGRRPPSLALPRRDPGLSRRPRAFVVSLTLAYSSAR